jgi:hypothetical protein
MPDQVGHDRTVVNRFRTLACEAAGVNAPTRTDRPAWTGELPTDPLRDRIAVAPRARVEDAAPLLALLFAFGMASMLYPLAWWWAWHSSGSPAVYSTGPTGGEVGAAAAGAAAMLLFGRRRLRLGWRVSRAVILVMCLIIAARFVDYQIAVRTDGPSRLAPLFVERAEPPHFRRHDFSLEPTIRVSGLAVRWEEIVVPKALLAGLVPGDTCVTARLAERRGYVFVRFEKRASAGGGSGSYLVRDSARARCLAG